MKTLEDYIALGYRFEILATGYSVWHKTTFVGGSSILNPVEKYKRMHWRTRIANVEDNKRSAARIAEHHFEELKL